jgi:hypothetical protein
VVAAGEVEQRVLVWIGDEDDVPAAPAVPAVRPALGDELLAPERDAPRAAVPGLHVNFRFVDEHGDSVAAGDTHGKLGVCL